MSNGRSAFLFQPFVIHPESVFPLPDFLGNNGFRIVLFMFRNGLSNDIRTEFLNFAKTQFDKMFGYCFGIVFQPDAGFVEKYFNELGDLLFVGRGKAQPELEAPPYGPVQEFRMVARRDDHDIGGKAVDLE